MCAQRFHEVGPGPSSPAEFRDVFKKDRLGVDPAPILRSARGFAVWRDDIGWPMAVPDRKEISDYLTALSMRLGEQYAATELAYIQIGAPVLWGVPIAGMIGQVLRQSRCDPKIPAKSIDERARQAITSLAAARDATESTDCAAMAAGPWVFRMIASAALRSFGVRHSMGNAALGGTACGSGDGSWAGGAVSPVGTEKFGFDAFGVFMPTMDLIRAIIPDLHFCLVRSGFRSIDFAAEIRNSSFCRRHKKIPDSQLLTSAVGIVAVPVPGLLSETRAGAAAEESARGEAVDRPPRLQTDLSNAIWFYGPRLSDIGARLLQAAGGGRREAVTNAD